MCGICGFIGFKDDAFLKEMALSIAHRGMDDEGYFVDNEVSLGFRRLSIIDLSGGNQPLFNENKTVSSVCNGEIYNFKEIKESLINKGHTFVTHCDTEVIPHAYEEWGISFISRLNGMFAFALWDAARKSLFLVRDRLGIRPLHYYLDGRKLIFASEIKALLKYKSIDKTLEPGAMDDFLTFRYIPGDVTFFKQVRVLDAAHVLEYHGGSIVIKRYWDIPIEQEQKAGRDNPQRTFYNLLDNSVRRCLLSDVPLGVYLSGGLDSSVLSALVKKHYSGKLTVFSHGFDGESDELKYARAVAKHLAATHHEVLIKEEHLDLLPEIIYHMDMPIANSDIVGFYLLAEMASKHVKVVITGEGSDELFGSYVHQEMLYYGHKLKQFIPRFLWQKIFPGLVKASPLGLLNKFFRYPGYSLDNESRLKVLDYFSSNDLSRDYFSINSLFNPRQKAELYSPSFSRHIGEKSLAKKNLEKIFFDDRISHVFNRLIYLEFKYWLPTYHLMKEDKIGMSFGLESRYPYLDHELVEFMGRLPVSLKKKGLKRKYLLRQVSRGLIPEQIRKRPKGPILVPINKCFEKSFQRMLAEYLSETKVKKRGYFNFAYIKHLVDNRGKNPFLYDRQLFALLSLEVWHTVFVDRSSPQYC